MSTTDVQEFDLQPDPRILPMLGEINLAQWKCLAELIDNSVDGFLSMKREKGSVDSPEVHVQVPLVDAPNARVIVRDNGPGMTSDGLERAVRAGWSGTDAISSLGMFGMGFNIATARLGTATTVWTTQTGQREWVGLKIDFEALRMRRSFKTPRIERPKDNSSDQGTEIQIEGLKPEQRQWFMKAGNRTKLVSELKRAYSAMLIPAGVPIAFRLFVNGQPILGHRHCVWGGPGGAPRVIETARLGPVDAFQSIERRLEPRPYCMRCWQWLPALETVCPFCQSGHPTVVTRSRTIRGWIGIQRYLSETDYGIDFLRHGRKIEIASKDLFHWQGQDGDRGELEYPIDDPRGRGRIVGELHLDHCRVNYTKDRFERSDPAWDDMVRIVRGEGPLRPEKAAESGFLANTSPLFQLYQIFRRSTPKNKAVAGSWAKLLAISDNDQAEEMAKKFREGDSAYQTDEKWWALIQEEERRLLVGPGTGVQPRGSDGGGPLPGFGTPAAPTAGSASPTPKPSATATTPAPTSATGAPIPSLTRVYVSDSTGQKWNVAAFQVDETHGALRTGKLPWVLRVLPNGVHQFLVNVRHSVFFSATLTPLDALLGELAWSAMDFSKDNPGDATFGFFLAELRQRYATATMIDPQSLSTEARQVLQSVAATLPRNIEPSDAPVLFRELAPEAQRAVFERMASRGVNNPQSIISSGHFLEYAPPRVVLDFFGKHPELFLDGKCWDDAYGTLDYELPTATEVAQRHVTRHYQSLLSDAVWLSDQDPVDLAQASRARLLRAMHALELLSPASEEDGD